jgi:hypothetical protein
VNMERCPETSVHDAPTHHSGGRVGFEPTRELPSHPGRGARARSPVYLGHFESLELVFVRSLEPSRTPSQHRRAIAMNLRLANALSVETDCELPKI